MHGALTSPLTLFSRVDQMPATADLTNAGAFSVEASLEELRSSYRFKAKELPPVGAQINDREKHQPAKTMIEPGLSVRQVGTSSLEPLQHLLQLGILRPELARQLTPEHFDLIVQPQCNISNNLGGWIGWLGDHSL